MPDGHERGVARLIDLAERALQAGDRQRALSLAKQALTLKPNDPPIRALLDRASVDQRASRWAPAIRRGTRLPLLLATVVVVVLLVAALVYPLV